MDLHSLSNTKGAKSSRIRLGRGLGSKGKTCGKGHKGQMVRKGNKHKLGFEGGQMPLIRRLPKRGFHNPPRKELLPINVGDLALFEDGAEVTMLALRESGLANGVADGIKILGRGELNKKLNVKASSFSASAKAKIEAAGGSCEVVIP